MEMGSTQEELEELKQSIDAVVEEIRENVPYETLDFDAMVQIQLYLGRNYSTEKDEFGFYGAALSTKRNAYPSNVAYKLIKDQIEQDLDLPEKEKGLLLDTVIGWIQYNPGKFHVQEQNRILQEYIDQYGLERLKQNMDIVDNKFDRLQSISKGASYEIHRIIERNKLEQDDYATMFRSSMINVSSRIENIQEILGITEQDS